MATPNALSGTSTVIFPPTPTIYTVEFLLSLRDLPFCRQKPSDLPDLIDKDKGVDSAAGKGIRKQRRPGPNEEGEAGPSQSYFDASADGGEFFVKGKGGKGGKGSSNRHDWQQQQSFNERQEESHALPRNPQGRIIPGKGVPRKAVPSPRVPEEQQVQGKWDHQPALANVVTRQQQGMTGATGSVAKGLDAFCMGDIRQAERFIEGGLGLDEYARRLASGEISAKPDVASSGGFFATDEDDGGQRPWEKGARIVPGFAAQRPPAAAPVAAAPSGPIGKDSNVAGLALLQMLVDRKAAAASAATAKPAPRQLSQQQINELIAMSKKGPVTRPAAPAPTRIIPGQRPAPNAPNAQVTALLEQLQRQQQAQHAQQAGHASQAQYAPQAAQESAPSPPECQQQ